MAAASVAAAPPPGCELAMIANNTTTCLRRQSRLFHTSRRSLVTTVLYRWGVCVDYLIWFVCWVTTGVTQKTMTSKQPRYSQKIKCSALAKVVSCNQSTNIPNENVRILTFCHFHLSVSWPRFPRTTKQQLHKTHTFLVPSRASTNHLTDVSRDLIGC